MSERSSDTLRGRDTSTPQDGADVHRRIDEAYDRAETFVAGVGRVLGVDTSGRRAGDEIAIGRPAIQLPVTQAPAQRALPPAGAAFRAIEKAPGQWVVTNGHDVAPCTSRDNAERVLEQLRKRGVACDG
jgi:hypothetical protein